MVAVTIDDSALFLQCLRALHAALDAATEEEFERARGEAPAVPAEESEAA